MLYSKLNVTKTHLFSKGKLNISHRLYILNACVYKNTQEQNKFEITNSITKHGFAI